jgi:hypothetical protein
MNDKENTPNQEDEKFTLPEESQQNVIVAAAKPAEPYNPQKRMRISREEWFAISSSLEEHHAVFYKVWQMGKPHFTDDVETAAVQFDETGNFIWFHFNPKFWKTLNHYNKLFVIRISDAPRINRNACNAALDVVVNHTLLRNFGFERDKIINGEKLCWVDTVYKGRKPLPPDDEMYEFYYNLFEKVYGHGGQGEGDDGDGDNTMGSMPGGTVDDHSKMGNSQSDEWGKVIDKLSEGLSDEEKDSLKKMVQKHFQKPDGKGQDALNTQAGTGTGGQWVFASVQKVKKKKKWETVIKKWSAKYMKTSDKEIEQWARINRRMVMLPKGMFLPTDMEVEEDADEKTRIKVYFYLDTSGSCWGLKDRFFAAAMSLPEERFDIRLFCFDTQVQETTLESRKIYGGGGTSFHILEDFIQKDIKAKGDKYPEAVFVITDGYGDRVNPERPEKWYWFITAGGTRSYINKDCNFFNLDEFE